MSLQAATEACVPDSEKPQHNASAAFIASPLPAQHPGIQSDVVLDLEPLQQGGHTQLQLHLR